MSFSLVQAVPAFNRTGTSVGAIAPLAGADPRQEKRVSETDADLALVKRVQNGERGAFDLLVRKYQHKVFGIISRYINNFAECQDVAQDTFLRAYRAIGKFRGDSAFYTWLFTIATNTAKNHLVAQRRRPPLDDVQIEDAELFDGALKLKETATPEHELMRQEVERAVTGAVAALPEELRMAITLREVDGLSYEEIAQTMNCPIGTVRSRIFRAREAIDVRLRPLMGNQSAGLEAV
jgi:RNA polymerase sigma-70 factor (ECF subfamily)